MKSRKFSLLIFAAVLLAPLGAGFSVSSKVLAAGGTSTWSGAAGDGKFSTAGNWDVLPTDGDSLIIPALVNTQTLDNDSLTSVASVTFSDTPGQVVSGSTIARSTNITGNNVTVAGSVSVGSLHDAFLNVGLTYASNQVINLADDTSEFQYKSISIGGYTVEMKSSVTIDSGLSQSQLPRIFNGAPTASISMATGGVLKLTNIQLSDEGNNSGSILGGTVQMTDSVSTITSTNFGSASLKLLKSRLDPSGATATINNPVEFDRNLFGKLSNDSSLIGYEVINAVPNQSGAPATILAGPVTLKSDVAFDPFSGDIKITGALSGNFLIGVSAVYDLTVGGHIIIDSSANTSLMPNGIYVIQDDSATLSDSKPAENLIISVGRVVTLNGTRGIVIVAQGATLNGTGTAQSIHALSQAHVAPGNSPGCLNSSGLVMDPGSVLDEELGGTTACSGYDQIKVTGTVTITGTILSTTFFNGFQPSAGQSFTVIDNDATDAVVGTFANLAEGATFTNNGYVFKVSYVGGSGNDVVLTVQGVPSAPNTGMRLLTANPLITLIVTSVMAGGMVFLTRRMQHAK